MKFILNAAILFPLKLISSIGYGFPLLICYFVIVLLFFKVYFFSIFYTDFFKLFKAENMLYHPQ